MRVREPRVGLLPLYLKLYDDTIPRMRETLEPFLDEVAAGLEAQGLEVVRAGVCRQAREFRAAVEDFEAREADAIVTLHLAYSPSLESTATLRKTHLPVVILDTTLDPTFGCDTDPDRLLYNHGIHGVMDLASMLRREGKPYQIVAGHYRDSDVLARAAALARAAYAARCFSHTRALRIGESFRGMGDFCVADELLAHGLGIQVQQIEPGELEQDVAAVTGQEVDRELERDRESFACELDEEVHARSVRVSLGLRKRLASRAYDAFSMNFAAFDSPSGPLDTPPFLEASKAMARGVGYGGEGDVLTAALVGALAKGFGRTTFAEIFCPDWRSEALFISHMGEINPEVAAERPRLIEKPFPFTPACNPAVLTCAPAPGPAVLVNLAPGPGESFSLIGAPVEVLEDRSGNEWADTIRGWLRPAGGVAPFLEAYSRLGGTHHNALVLGQTIEAIRAFAAFANLPFHAIPEAG